MGTWAVPLVCSRTFSALSPPHLCDCTRCSTGQVRRRARSRNLEHRADPQPSACFPDHTWPSGHRISLPVDPMRPLADTCSCQRPHRPRGLCILLEADRTLFSETRFCKTEQSLQGRATVLRPANPEVLPSSLTTEHRHFSALSSLGLQGNSGRHGHLHHHHPQRCPQCVPPRGTTVYRVRGTENLPATPARWSGHTHFQGRKHRLSTDIAPWGHMWEEGTQVETGGGQEPAMKGPQWPRRQRGPLEASDATSFKRS